MTREIIVANTNTTFDALIIESALIAVFMNAEDYGRFSTKNLRLTKEIEAIFYRLYDEKFADQHFGVGYDWWPDHTRIIECDVQIFSQQLFDDVSALLVNQYDEWRIQIAVYNDVMDGTTIIGIIAIWSDKMLIDLELYHWLQGQNFNFGANAKPRFVDFTSKQGDTLLDDVN